MRIGILTFQGGFNFGAQLQCFAMQEVLRKLGHNPEIVQLELSKATPFYRGIGIKKNGFKKAIQIMLLRLFYASRMRKRFTLFKKNYLNLSLKCSIDTIAAITAEYDAIITGSDQIWGWSNHNHASFFIGWEPEFKGLRISYAPCCAKNQIEDKNRERIGSLLNKYHALSVRNEETFNFVKDLTGREVPIVADPTFLIDFRKYVAKQIAPYEKYIVTYILGSEINGGHREMISNIRKEVGEIPVVAIVLTENKPMLCSWADKTYWTADPMEWVNLLYYSEFVYTDSFHALVFALKFHKRFIAYYAESERASRFIDMAKRYHISHGIVTSVKEALNKDSFNYTPDYNAIDPIIKEQVQLSVDFLRKALMLHNI